MIVQFFIDIVFGFLEGLLGLLPDWTPYDLSGLVDALDANHWTNGTFLAWLNQYVPIEETVTVSIGFLSLFVAMFVYNQVVWILTKLHVLGGSSD